MTMSVATAIWVSCAMAIITLPYYAIGLPPGIKSEYKSFISGSGLYDENDGIVILNASNFARTVFGKPNSWVVEFYNSWCGHCFAFAPTWKQLANDIYGWRSVVKLAAIDCAVDENTPVCREYDIMGYPTLKFFRVNAPPTDTGTEIEKQSTYNLIRQSIIDILRKEQMEGRGVDWPNLGPYRGNDLHNLWHEVESRNHTTEVFLLLEEPNQFLSSEVILDLSSIRDIDIRTVTSNNEVLMRTLGARTVPGLLHLGKDQQPEPLHPEEFTRDGVKQSIVAFLEAKGVPVNLEKLPSIAIKPVKAVDMEEIMQLRGELMELQKIRLKGDVVFLADLETALRYMLQHEIPARKIISGEALVALNDFLSVLAKYFPAGERGIVYLQALKDEVFRVESEGLRGVKFKALVRDTEGGLKNALATEDGWIGCKGSEKHFRGFPCGVWTLFHFLTVAAFKDSDHAHFDPLQVLNAMLGYVTHFFGCTPCSQHFKEMANRSMRAKVTEASKSVLWLWSAHNEVNKRLKGGPTEDPEFPKMQYPSEELCPRCMDTSQRWREDVVLAYLKGKYQQDSLDVSGANTELLPPQKQSTRAERRKLVGLEVDELDSGKTTRYFNSLDISLVIGLYLASAFIIIAVCWKFLLKRYMRDGCQKTGWTTVGPYHRKKMFFNS